MGSIRFLSGVCAEHLQECVPIQLLSRNPHSSVLLGAALRFSVAAALAMGAPSPSPSKRMVFFSVKEAGTARQTLSPCRKEGSSSLGRRGPGGASDSLQLPAVWPPSLSLPWVPGSDSLWAAGQAVKRGVCEAFSFLMLYQAAKNSSIFSQRWCRSREWKC